MDAKIKPLAKVPATVARLVITCQELQFAMWRVLLRFAEITD
jgi:hypothetical protein